MSVMYRKQAATVILPLLLAWLTGDSSEALSSFGVSNIAPTKSPTPVTPTDFFNKMTMWQRPSVVMPLLLSVWLFGLCLGAFSPSFGVIRTESPIPFTTAAPTAIEWKDDLVWPFIFNSLNIGPHSHTN
ncbi:hypothetical protein MSG28_016215 [Choristoneura fumiferana]|uniref:Uncharacterized protein n=1 Tax=Choristoneura fumiferana TaxID=7141 RepID=A0ACC0K6L2_CHOFU|nr:hypothetical protein MSG28_016215 [Choristoneura fumiferana]